MKKFVLATAAVILLGTSAFAQGNSFSFKVDGQNVRVHVPKSCMSLSCISVSAPGLANKDDDDDKPARTAKNTPAASAPAAPVAAAPAQPTAPAPVATATTAAPAAIQQAAVTPPAETEKPATTGTASAPTPPAPAPVQTAAPAAPAAAAPTVVASAPAAAPVTPTAAPVAANTPVGIWMTEKNEGKVRIEKCGDNLCGYAIDDKTSANGKQVLINMKPKGEKWAGRIHDTRGGGTYDSTIAMRGDNGLRVQGCAFGGMFCGGQTWTRVQ
jgi:uncharacterized protein (DUF2147 family)